MSARAVRNRRLRWALQGRRSLPPERVAILIDEDGRLQAQTLETAQQPRFIETEQRIGVRRLTYRYVRTDIVCQGGYRVYTLSEISGSDDALERALASLGQRKAEDEDGGSSEVECPAEG